MSGGEQKIAGRVRFVQFRSLVLSDQNLLGELRGISGFNDFVSGVVQRGADHGFTFSPDDVQAAMQESRRAWLERWI